MNRAPTLLRPAANFVSQQFPTISPITSDLRPASYHPLSNSGV
jgi:hypothetical protein